MKSIDVRNDVLNIHGRETEHLWACLRRKLVVQVGEVFTPAKQKLIENVRPGVEGGISGENNTRDVAVDRDEVRWTCIDQRTRRAPGRVTIGSFPVEHLNS